MMAKVLVVSALFSTFQINIVNCQALATKNAVPVNRRSDADIHGMSGTQQHNTQTAEGQQEGGSLSSDKEKQNKDISPSLQKLQTRNTNELNRGMLSYLTVEPIVVTEKYRKQSKNIPNILKTATLNIVTRIDKPNLQYENKQANEISEIYSTAQTQKETSKINDSNYFYKHVISPTRNQNQPIVNSNLNPSSQVPFKWKSVNRSTINKFVSDGRNNPFQTKENTIKSSEKMGRHLISAITSKEITGIRESVQNEIHVTTASTFEARNKISTGNMYSKKQVTILRNQTHHITDKFDTLTYGSPTENEVLRENQLHHDNTTHESSNGTMKTVYKEDADDHMKFRSSSSFKNTHTITEKKNTKTYFKDPCSRLDLQFCNSFSYATVTLWVLVIGGIVVFLFIFIKRRCARYIRGDYRPVPHEYDFELNLKYKNN